MTKWSNLAIVAVVFILMFSVLAATMGQIAATTLPVVDAGQANMHATISAPLAWIHSLPEVVPYETTARTVVYANNLAIVLAFTGVVALFGMMFSVRTGVAGLILASPAAFYLIGLAGKGGTHELFLTMRPLLFAANGWQENIAFFAEVGVYALITVTVLELIDLFATNHQAQQAPAAT